MRNILSLKELSKNSIEIAGGKGANLGEMFNAGFNVPEAFVVSAQAYADFLGKDLKNKIAKELNKLNIEDSVKLDKISKKIQSLIEKAEFPKELKEEIESSYKNINDFVAVRSSATTEDLKTASFAGMQATFLNIKGLDQLIKHVQKCWASLFTSRAIYYRTQNKFDHLQAKIAVVVQRMVNSDTSGVCFTVNPINNNRNDIVIESSFGLGEAVVAGEVTPDMYIVHKDTQEIHTKNINEQTWGYFKDQKTGKTVKKNVKDPNAQVLTDKQIKQVAELARKIEQHYNHPQDIEFAFEKDILYLLQARPVTTLSFEDKNNDELREITELKKYSFERYERFPVQPLISYEHAFRSYVDNSFFLKMKLKEQPRLVVLQHNNYEAWEEKETRVKLEDKKIINSIIAFSRKKIKEYYPSLNKFLSLPSKKMNDKVCVTALNRFNQIFRDIYQGYIFFCVEYFNTRDNELIKRLPEIRMELSEFASSVWKSYDKILYFLESAYSLKKKKGNMCTNEEILSLLTGDKSILEVKNLEKRHIAFVIKDNSFNIYINEKAEAIKNFLNAQNPLLKNIEHPKKEGLIIGNVAHKGI